MRKSKKMPKKMSGGQKLLFGLAGVGLIGAGIGVASVMGASANTGDVVVHVDSGSNAKAPLNVISTDAVSGDDVSQLAYAVSGSGKAFTFNTSTEFTDTLISGNDYSVYLFDSPNYGSSIALSDNDKSGATLTSDGGAKFTLGAEGTDLKLEVNLISDYMLKAEDEINGQELYNAGSKAYTGDDSVVFASQNGSVIAIDDQFDSTVFVKPDTRDAVANDNGMLVVINSDNDEWENLEVTFAGASLTQLSRDDLKNMFADVNYDNFRTDKVFMVKPDVKLARNSEYELGISSSLIDGASITKDITADIYTLGYIQTADGRQLSALNKDGTPVHPSVDKDITFNLA